MPRYDLTDRYAGVLVLLLITYVLASALPGGPVSEIVLTLVQGITVLAALRASVVAPRHLRSATAAAGTAVIAATIVAIIGRSSGVPALIDAVLLAVSLGAILARISHHDHVSSGTLFGAMCCYVLFGLVYAFIYAGVARFSSWVFLVGSGHQTLSDTLFFSFTTLTTTGYGDLVPATGLGRALAMLEAITGQLFLVTILARLVAMWVPTRRGDRAALRVRRRSASSDRNPEN